MPQLIKTIALGTAIQPGPFGGGNQFAQTFSRYARQHHIEVVFDLKRPDIDGILVTSVKPWARGAGFDIVAALRYASAHPATALVLRVNECDERKGHQTHLLNQLLRNSLRHVDHTVFVSEWLQQTLLASTPHLTDHSSVIHSGADPAIFNPHGRTVWDRQEPLKIVTHHWSSSWHKGWDVYQALDTFLGTPAGENYAFTFIGNPWPKAQLRHTTVLPPQSGPPLATLLKQHHIYISASQHEPAGMHYIEALQCGLPILFRPSGSLSEYCAPYGVTFDTITDIPAALEELRHHYTRLTEKTAASHYTADDMNQAYLRLFESLRDTTPARRESSLLTLRGQQALLWARDSLL